MATLTHRRLIDVIRDWFRHLFHHEQHVGNSTDEFERFFGQ
jgi:hypothetical protein